MAIKVRIETKRKCYGTFDLDYEYGQGHIPIHSKRIFYPKLGILSFEDDSIQVEIEFTEEQWKKFINDMTNLEWIEKEHLGQC